MAIVNVDNTEHDFIIISASLLLIIHDAVSKRKPPMDMDVERTETEKKEGENEEKYELATASTQNCGPSAVQTVNMNECEFRIRKKRGIQCHKFHQVQQLKWLSLSISVWNTHSSTHPQNMFYLINSQNSNSNMLINYQVICDYYSNFGPETGA